MEIIDCFCGIGAWAARDRLLPYRPEETLSLMDHFGIAKALVYHNSAMSGQTWTPDANAMVVEECAKEPRFIPAFVLSVNVHGPTMAETLLTMRAAKAKAAWLWMRNAGIFGSIKTWLTGDWLAACTEKRIPVLCHIEGLHFNDLHEMCSEFPDLTIILTGVSYGAENVLFPLMKKHDNLHLCLGHFYIPPGNPDRFLRHFPAERLIFGSGLPLFSPGSLIGHVMYADIDESSKAKILGGNLKRMMKEVQL